MKNIGRIPLIILLIALLVYPMGCLPEDPLPEDLFTKNVFPGTASTYDLGSEDLPYDEGNFDNLIVNEDTTTRRIAYSQLYHEDLAGPATALKLSGVKPPLNTLYKGGLVLEFEDKSAPNEQIVYFDLQMPSKWDEGTDIHVHIHWIPDADTAGVDRTVGWRLTTSWANIGEDFPAETTIDKTATINNQADQHILTFLSHLEDASKLRSSIIIASLMRLSDTDTFIGSAYLTEVDFHFEFIEPGDQEHMITD